MCDRTANKQEYIRIKEWPSKHALKAYKEGYYVEAIQVLHGFIENQARSLLMLHGAVKSGTDLSQTWDIVDEVPLKDIVKVLFAMGAFNEDEMNELLQLNSLRNKIIHRIYNEPYEKQYKGFPKVDYDRVFEIALNWSDKIREMNEDIIEEEETA